MANDVVCGVDGFGEAITSICMRHVAEQRKGMDKLVERAAKKSASVLRSGAATPRRTGDYASSFRAKRTDSDIGHVEYTVGNVRRRGNLTHLLEDGHQLVFMGHRTDKRTRAFPHIVPAYEKGAEIIRRATVDQ